MGTSLKAVLELGAMHLRKEQSRPNLQLRSPSRVHYNVCRLQQTQFCRHWKKNLISWQAGKNTERAEKVVDDHQLIGDECQLSRDLS